MIDSLLKANPWTYKIKDINGKTIIESFYEKELLLNKLQMSYYAEPDSDIREKKVNVVLDLSSYSVGKN